jgi:hypothetical protein
MDGTTLDMAERIGFELVVAFCRTIALYWPTECVFREYGRKERVQTGEAERLRARNAVFSYRSFLVSIWCRFMEVTSET